MSNTAFKNILLGADEMVQQVKILVTKPHDLILVPRTHVVEEENRFPQVLSQSHAYPSNIGINVA